MKKPAIAIVMLIVISGFVASPLFSEPLPSFPLNAGDLNALDRALMQPYNGLLDDAATILELGMLAAPGAFLLVPGADWLSDGLMYAETGIIAFGARTLLKKTVSRPRPYMYFDSFPQDKVDDGDWNESFPSGHTTMCFMSASYVAYMFNTRYPDSPWKMPLILSAYGLAAGTGAMRMASGNHFLTDVLTGAAVGTAVGFIIPWAHDKIASVIGVNRTDSDGTRANPAVSAYISPFSLGFSINF